MMRETISNFFERASLPETRARSLFMRQPMRDGFNIFAHFMVVSAQIVSLDRPVAPFTQQLLRYQWILLESVIVGTFVQEIPC